MDDIYDDMCYIAGTCVSTNDTGVTDVTGAGWNNSMDMDTFGHINTDARYGECSAHLLTCQIQRYLFLVMSPVLILIATVGNALALAVMCRRNLRGTPTAVFIASLAVSDTVVVWTALTRHFIKKYNEVCQVVNSQLPYLKIQFRTSGYTGIALQ